MLKLKPIQEFKAFKILKVRSVCMNAEYELTIEDSEKTVWVCQRELYRGLPEVDKYIICKEVGEILIPQYILSAEQITKEFEIIIP